MATMLGFAGSMAFSQHVAAKLDEDAVSIATNASPAIERLSAARGELFQLSLATVSAVLRLGEGRLPNRAPFVESLARLHDQLSAYLAMPFYPGERERFVDVGRATHDLDARVSAFLGFLEARDSRGAATVLRTGVSPDAARVDSAIGNLIAFNAEQQHRLATDIPKQRRQGDRIGYVLEAATAVFGLILMGLVTRAIRQYANLLRSRHRLAADHARRVVAFGAKLESIIAASTNISGAITTVADPHRVFQIIADEARLVVNAQYCAVGCGTDPTRPFNPWVASGMPAYDRRCSWAASARRRAPRRRDPGRAPDFASRMSPLTLRSAAYRPNTRRWERFSAFRSSRMDTMSGTSTWRASRAGALSPRRTSARRICWLATSGWQ